MFFQGMVQHFPVSFQEKGISKGRTEWMQKVKAKIIERFEKGQSNSVTPDLFDY